MKSFTFDGEMSRQVLNNYLSRAVTHTGIGYDNLRTSETFEDDLRMLKNEGAKFIGRAAYVWAESVPDDEHFAFAKARAARAHEVDTEFLLQACIFECIYRPYVNSISIPNHVFEAFGLPVESRCFDFDRMKLEEIPEGYWGRAETAVPDITRLESQMWVYHRAVRYIDAGFEALHLGQVCLTGRHDPDFESWRRLAGKIRAYAKQHARRHFVLLDAHTMGDLRQDDRLVDYNAFPIRLKEVVGQPLKCVCEEGYRDSMFNPRDGLARPFLVEFDNWGRSDTPGQATPDHDYAWGYDEITWWSNLDADYRKEFLPYIWNWVKARYPEGHVQMPSRRLIVGEARYNYSANTASPACPHGWSDEETIKAIFLQDDRD